jgi:hypothetical protein
LQALDELGRDPIRLVEEEALVGLLVEPGDTLEDVLLGPRRHARHLADAAGLGRLPELVDRGDTELEVELTGGPGSDAADPEHADQAGRDLLTKALVVLGVAGRGQLGQPRPERGADAGDLRRPAGDDQRDEVGRIALDGVCRPAVGDRLVGHLAEQLEHVADLTEGGGQLRVR